MPLIRYICSCNKTASKFYRLAKDAPSGFTCTDCGKEFKKQLSSPSNASKITIDNGAQAKAVEVNLDVINSNLENSLKDFKKDS